MSSSEPAEGAETFFTVSQAADYMRVSSNTPYNWIKESRIEAEQKEGVTVFALSTLRKAKLLRETELLNHLAAEGIKDDRIVARAVADGVVRASPAPDVRYSMEDVEAIAAYSREGRATRSTTGGEVVAPSAVSTPSPVPKNPRPVAPDEHLVRTGRWEILMVYVIRGPLGNPMRMTPSFWDTRDCPEFVPSADIFHYTYGYRGFDEETGSFIYIRQSAGWVLVDDKPWVVPEDEFHGRSDTFHWPPGKEAAEFATENMRWRQQRLEWEEAWYLRRRHLRAEGSNPLDLPSSAPAESRNPQLLLRKYHEESWGPSDLPDWFWDAERCPPFEPPNEACRYQFGEQGVDPKGSGEMGTYIRSEDVWNWSIDELCHRPGDERFDWVPGLHAAGGRPAKFEKENRECDAAEHAWEEEWRRRARRRRGE